MVSSAAFFHKHLLNNHVRSAPSPSRFQTIGARSTAQAGLQRILQTILFGTGGSEDKGLGPRKSEAERFGSFGIDLNLRLFSFEPENLAGAGDSRMCSGVREGGDDGVDVVQGLGLSSSMESCNASTVVMSTETFGQKEGIAEAGRREEGEEALEVSDVTNSTAMAVKKEGDDASDNRGKRHQELEHAVECRAHNQDDERKLRKMDDRSGGGGGGGYLHLLLEAVRHVSGDFEEDKPTPRPAKNKRRSCPNDGAVRKVAEPRRGARRSHDWLVEFYGAFEGDTAPLVRSKRGRSQALPSRYRDTILDPWRK